MAGMPGAMRGALQRSPMRANRQSIVALAFAGIYVFLAMTAHSVLLGIISVLASLRALGCKEPLAPLALVCSVLFAFMGFTAFR